MPRGMHWDEYMGNQPAEERKKIEACIIQNYNSMLRTHNHLLLEETAREIWPILDQSWPGNPYSVEDIEAVIKGKSSVGEPCQPSSSLPDYSLDETLRTLMALAQSADQLDYKFFGNIFGQEIEVMAHIQSDQTLPADMVRLILTVSSIHSGQPVTLPTSGNTTESQPG